MLKGAFGAFPWVVSTDLLTHLRPTFELRTGILNHKYTFTKNISDVGFLYRVFTLNCTCLNIQIESSCKIFLIISLYLMTAEEMDQADEELRGTIQHIWPFQAKKMLDLLIPRSEQLNRSNLTVGKIYAGFLILESWRNTRFGQIESGIPVSQSSKNYFSSLPSAYKMILDRFICVIECESGCTRLSKLFRTKYRLHRIWKKLS